MWLMKCFIVIVLLSITVEAQIWSKIRLRKRLQEQIMNIKTAINLKNSISERIKRFRERNTQSVCYDIVGCFKLPHKNSPLQKHPEDPKMLDTKFYLFTRSTDLAKPEILFYDDGGESLKISSFNLSNPLKVIVHGYVSKWNEKGSLIIMKSYLKMFDYNVILMDWHIGARGPQYPVAAANTEVVGRQLGILLTNMVKKGLEPRKIHLIGFSLGAHVCGTASESLKNEGHLIGRITGLDPASPLFRNNYLREKYKKLDRSDAEFVDVVHTDSSPYLTDGFGLWDPIGHVDFFPNGGQDQPGCNDVKDSIVVSHFERGLSSELVCSHIRAFHLFRESIENMVERKKGNTNVCEMTAYYCPRGRISFEEGSCFPQISHDRNSTTLDPSYRTDIGNIGEEAKGEGVMFLSTRSESQYCGTQLQAQIELSKKNEVLKGILQLQLNYENSSVVFQLNCEYKTTDIYEKITYGLGVAEHNTLNKNVNEIMARFSYLNLEEYEMSNNDTKNVSKIFFNNVIVRDMYGNSWEYQHPNTKIEDVHGQIYGLLSVIMKRKT
ncbi:pancreatic lipase-related protein 2-like [Diorhabda sublineata]|uniref:pancreatic lipase-related protein 2-like n=1 Tax=Diorhabda sublineata TaxID=1163346 RepID=UPI0024E0E945|nr:pancreatic lipase-related protein 2-like [Diorhabda sublineata]